MAISEEERDIIPQSEHNAGAIKTPTGGAMFYSAPIPPASEFAKYEQVLHGSADRILSMAERQSSHRHFIEKVVIVFDAVIKLGGLISALVIVIAGIVAGVYLIMHDKSVAGFLSLITPLGVVAATFLFKKEDDE